MKYRWAHYIFTLSTSPIRKEELTVGYQCAVNIDFVLIVTELSIVPHVSQWMAVEEAIPMRRITSERQYPSDVCLLYRGIHKLLNAFDNITVNSIAARYVPEILHRIIFAHDSLIDQRERRCRVAESLQWISFYVFICIRYSNNMINQLAYGYINL